VVHGEHVNRVRSDSVYNAIVAPDDFADIITTELRDDSARGWELMKPLNRPDDSFGDESSVAG